MNGAGCEAAKTPGLAIYYLRPDNNFLSGFLDATRGRKEWIPWYDWSAFKRQHKRRLYLH